ncbi:unnamed protein product [Ixodes persulcatus]
MASLPTKVAAELTTQVSFNQVACPEGKPAVAEVKLGRADDNDIGETHQISCSTWRKQIAKALWRGELWAKPRRRLPHWNSALKLCSASFGFYLPHPFACFQPCFV